MVEHGAQPFVGHRWDIRFRVRDGGDGSWGVVDTGVDHAPLPVVEWSVSRSRNAPATASLVIDPGLLEPAHQEALLDMLLHGPKRFQKWGVSLFRDDEPEANQGVPVFFGVIRTVDIPADGPITLQAEDMLSVLNEIIVDDYTTGDAKLPVQRILSGMSGAWADSFPESTSITWDVQEGIADRSLTVEAKDLRTLYEVLHGMAEEDGFEFFYESGVNIVLRRKDPSWHFRLSPTDRLLEGSSSTRLLGPESEATIVVASGEETHPNTDPKTKDDEPEVDVHVVQRAATRLADGQFHQGFPYSVRSKGRPGSVKQAAMTVLGRMLSPSLSASLRFEWPDSAQFPRPGQQMSVTVPTPMFDIDGVTRRNIHFEGFIQSVTITDVDVSVDVVCTEKNEV